MRNDPRRDRWRRQLPGAGLAWVLALLCSAAPAHAGPAGADFNVVDQSGVPVQFYRDIVADKTVVVNFIYTHCTAVCPAQGMRFQALQKLLGGRLEREVRLVSISLDPPADTPAALRRWATRYGARSGWRLVTGKPETVAALISSILGGPADKQMHSPFLMVGDGSGAWTRTFGMDSPDRLLQQLDQVQAKLRAVRGPARGPP